MQASLSGCDVICIMITIGLFFYLIISIATSSEEALAIRRRIEKERLDQVEASCSHTQGLFAQLLESIKTPQLRRDALRLIKNGSFASYTDSMSNQLQAALADCEQSRDALNSARLQLRKSELENTQERLDRLAEALETKAAASVQAVEDAQGYIGEFCERSKYWASYKTKPLFSDYGHVDESILSVADALNDSRVTSKLATPLAETIDQWHGLVNNPPDDSFDEIRCIDMAVLPYAALSFARAKHPDLERVNRCDELWTTLTRSPSILFFIAKLYAKKGIGGDNAVRDELRGMLHEIPSNWYEHIASSLMWMESYGNEADVLQRMLSGGYHMSNRAKERLHYLSSSKDAVAVHKIDPNELVLSFDTSSLSWDEGKFSSLFDNLVFQGAQLEYALAVREESKDLAITNASLFDDKEALLPLLTQSFNEEYGEEVEIGFCRCAALADGVREEFYAFKIAPVHSSRMSLIAIADRIGKRISIVFYTIYNPVGNIEKDRVGALSLSKGLNPTSSRWEAALKSSMLEALQKIINSSIALQPRQMTPPSNGGVF